MRPAATAVRSTLNASKAYQADPVELTDIGSRFRRALSNARAARLWRPSSAALFYHGVVARQRNELHGLTDADHLSAAAAWLGRAQDSTGDGGVAGRYRLGQGWSSSYPETTGYLVPTFLALDSEGGQSGFRDRARRCIEFLLGIQLPSGAFPGLEIADNRTQPSIFNTAQILNGLTAWHAAAGDERVLTAARRAADWLASVQDADGAWRVHLYGSGRPYTYMAHAACWLAEFGQHVGDERYLAAARTHLEWVLSHVDPQTGWIDDCGFSDDDHRHRRAVTHTIAYTIWGVLLMSRILKHDAGMEAARRAARAVARRLELSRRLPGKLDAQWNSAASYTCLTGNAQMALIWLELHRLDGDPSLVSTACKAIDLVKSAQDMRSRNGGIRGGIPGSDPVWGEYIPLALPNWAAKFFVDALLAKRRALASLALPARARGLAPEILTDVPTSLPPDDTPPSSRSRVVLLTGSNSGKVKQFCEAWKSWGFRPSAVVIHDERATPVADRAWQAVRSYGPRSLLRRVLRIERVAASNENSKASSRPNPADYCRTEGIPAIRVGSLSTDEDLAQLRALAPDILVYAGGGILRHQVLAIPRLGTLNAHMGLLPQMRGMNVAEWSAMCGIPLGATIHLIDEGIDTGDILLFASAARKAPASIDALRETVDYVQVDALGRVVQWVLAANSLPPRRVQKAREGRQFFTMHPDLRTILERSLRG